MSLKFDLSSIKEGQSIKCCKCQEQNQSEFLHNYFTDRIFANYNQIKYGDLKNYLIYPYCSKCFYEHLKEQNYFKQLHESYANLSEKLTVQNKTFNVEIAGLKEKITQMTQELSIQAKRISDYQQIVIDNECEQLIRAVNFQEISQTINQVNELSLEVKNIYEDQFKFRIFNYSTIDATIQELNRSFKNLLKNEMEKMLEEVKDYIKADLEKCKNQQLKMNEFRAQFVSQFQDILEDGTIEMQKFNSFVDTQQNSRKIEQKESTLEKINLIKEQTIKLLS